jgi:16S rRNA (cytosine967-C5)-methyltransferase
MSRAENQSRIFLRLVGELRPEWRTRTDLPARMRRLLSRSGRFGSRDRRLYRELLYTAVRHLPWVEPLLDTHPHEAAARVAWLSDDLPETREYRSHLAAGRPDRPGSVVAAAALLDEDPTALLPPWIARECPAALAPGEMDALHRRARRWIRLQADDPDSVVTELAAQGWTVHPSGVLPDAYSVERADAGDLTATPAFLRGALEVQDLGSQFVLGALDLEPGERWLDACAGAGGKTLQLAHRVRPTGAVDAHDVRAGPLRELARRADRAGLGNVRILSAPPTDRYDGVLVDAPCSGSGTWRRAPHLKWTTTPAELRRQSQRQARLLAELADRVRPGGRLVYATCSLARCENQDVVAAFLATRPDFREEPPARAFGFPPGRPGLSLFPARHDTDAFYLAVLRRR